MPDVQFGIGAALRVRGNPARLPLINMFVESITTEPRQLILQSRPALVATGTSLGTGPVKALFQKDGVLSGAMVGVSAGALHVGAAAKGSVVGAGSASIAGNELGVVATAGADMVFWDGTSFRGVAFPDVASVRKVAEQGGRFLMLRDGTGRFYWTATLASMIDGSGDIIVDGLDYATAESEPDQLLDLLAYEDAIALFGTATVEFWAKTGDVDLPYTPVAGRVFQKGIRATGCAGLFDNSFVWVSPDNIVYVAANVPQRVSDNGIEERIGASSTCRLDTFFFEGHEFAKITLDDGALLYDAQSRQWCEFRTGNGPFAGGPYAAGRFGSLNDGKLLKLEGYLELGGTLERLFALGFPLNGSAIRVNNLRLRANPGQTDYLTGEYLNPKAEMRYSYDKGETWEIWEETELGEEGQYLERVEWRGLGLFSDPGFLAQVRVTDPVPFSVSAVSVNERQGGRAR